MAKLGGQAGKAQGVLKGRAGTLMDQENKAMGMSVAQRAAALKRKRKANKKGK